MQQHSQSLVYIAGYGRSGSTLLDLMLGSCDEVVSLGEVGNAWEQLSQSGLRCSCGELYSDCPQWGPVVVAVGRSGKLSTWRKHAARRESLVRGAVCLLLGSFSSDFEYRLANATMLNALYGVDKPRFIIDSSKTAYDFAWRPLALKNKAELDVRMIHLVRNPFAVVAACLRGGNKQIQKNNHSVRPFAGEIALIGWIIANCSALLVGKLLPPGCYARVHYEELVENPERTLSALGEFLALDTECVRSLVQANDILDSGHLIAGNRMARAGSVRLQTAKRAERGESLPLVKRVLCKCFAGALYFVLCKPVSRQA